MGICTQGRAPCHENGYRSFGTKPLGYHPDHILYIYMDDLFSINGIKILLLVHLFSVVYRIFVFKSALFVRKDYKYFGSCLAFVAPTLW
jgi:hypothetical protein